MKLLPLSTIKISPERQRQEFEPEAMQKIKESIVDRGLMHPVVIRDTADGQHFLVAGERRLRAITEIYTLGGEFKCEGKKVPEGFVPTLSMGDLNPLEAEEAELDENLKRKDLTWQEHAAATSRLHALRQKQQQAFNELNERQPIDKVEHTIADTAREVRGSSDGWNQDQTRKEILVAKHLATNPAVAKAKTVDEAFKILKQQESMAKNAELAVLIGETFTAEAHTLLNTDCLTYMADKHEIFDVILTDPPYGMGADGFGDAGGKLSGIEHHYDDSPEAWRLLMAAWAPLSYQVAKPQAHAYVFCDFDRFHELKSFMAEAGWYVFRTPLVVHKLNSGRVPLPDQGPRRQYELVLYAIKGKKPVTHIYPDVLAATADENMTHGAQKPVAVYTNLLQRSVKPGDRIADFFCGTGGIFEAGHQFQCTVIATEKSPEYYAMAYKRLLAMQGKVVGQEELGL